MLYRIKTGTPWRDLPERYGNWKTVYSRWLRWRDAGVWQQVWERLQAQADTRGEVEWEIHFIDSTVVRAHQHAAGAKKCVTRRTTRTGRGGLTTKIHARVDGAGRLFTLLLTPGRQHDSTVAERAMRQGAIHTCQRGRPAVRPKRVAADKAYGSRAFKAWLRRHGIRPTIPRKSNQRRGRPHNTERYKSATTLSASSVGSSTSEPLPHATTNAPPAFWRPSCSLPFLSFCDLQTHPSIGD